LSVVKLCQVVEAGGGIGVLGTTDLLHNIKRPLQEWFCLLVAPLMVVKQRQAVEGGAGIGMVGAKDLLRNIKRPLQ
jgi:hypothetical protein